MKVTRTAAIREASRETRVLGAVLAAQTARTLQVTDTLLLQMQVRSTELGLATPDEFRRAMSSESVHRMLVQQTRELPQAQLISVMDSLGTIVNSSMPGIALPMTGFADRGYFLHAQQYRDAGPYFDGPLKGRITGETRLIMARRISAPDGTFLGVALATISLAYLQDYYLSVSRTGDRDSHFAVTLLRRTGLILLRSPAAGMFVGTVVPAASPWYKAVAQGGGDYRTAGYIDRVPALVSVHPLPRYPLVLDVSSPLSAVLRNWTRQSLVIGVCALLIAALLVELFRNVARQISDQARSHAALLAGAEALRASEARLRDFAGLASDWFWEQDAALRFTNIAFGQGRQLLDLPAFVGRHRWELIDTAPDQEKWRRHQQDLMERKPFNDFRYEVVDRAERIRHVSVSGLPLFDTAGAFVGYRGIGRDMTEQVEAAQEIRRAREKAERAEALLQDAIGSTAQGFAIYDSEDRLQFCNETYRRFRPVPQHRLAPGISFTEILRLGLAAGAYPEAAGQEQAWLEEWQATHQADACDRELLLWDGSWVLASSRRMRDGGVIALLIDIGVQKRAQSALRDSEARLERAQEIAGLGSWDYDRYSGRYRLSRQASSILELAGTAVLDRDAVLRKFSQDDQPAVDTWFRSLEAGQECLPIEAQLRQTGPDPRIVRLHGRVDCNHTGTLYGVSGTIQDVTERRAIEMQLIQAQKMEAIGTLTGGMAHDFNNVLGVIIGNIDLLRRRMSADRMAAELLDEVMDGATRCSNLIRRLLAFARRQPLRSQRTSMNALIADTARLLGRTLGEDIELRLSLDDNLLPAVVDPAQLEAALVNFAANARDAMPDGGRLDIVTRNVVLDELYADMHPEVQPGPYGLIEVTDTGVGIPPDIINRIFDPFFTTKPAGAGSGLGLSMVFGFAKQSGGHLSVYSEPGRGTTFRMYLPQNAPAADEPAIAGAAVRMTGGSETILVVEDNEALRRTTGRHLALLGYRVLEAENAAAALAQLDTEAVDLMLTDVVMPGSIDGFGLAERARARQAGLKVLLTSGFPDLQRSRRHREDLAFPILGKPYPAADLAAAVRTVLEGGEIAESPVGHASYFGISGLPPNDTNQAQESGR